MEGPHTAATLEGSIQSKEAVMTDVRKTDPVESGAKTQGLMPQPLDKPRCCCGGRAQSIPAMPVRRSQPGGAMPRPDAGRQSSPSKNVKDPRHAR